MITEAVPRVCPMTKTSSVYPLSLCLCVFHCIQGKATLRRLEVSILQPSEQQFPEPRPGNSALAGLAERTVGSLEERRREERR